MSKGKKKKKKNLSAITRRNNKLENEYPYVEHIIRLVHLVNECVDIDYPTNEGRRMIDCKHRRDRELLVEERCM